MAILLTLPFLVGATPFESPTEKGTQAYNAGRFDDALENYQKAAEGNPDKAEAHYNLGGAYYKKGEYDRALKEYDEAVKLDPKMADAWYNSGDALYRMGMYDKALDAFKKADGLKKGDADTQHNIDVVIRKVKQEKQKQQQKPPQGNNKQGQGKDDKGKGEAQDSDSGGQGSAGQGRQSGQDKGPSMSNEEIQAMMERQKKEEKQLRNYFRPGQKEQKDDREAQIEQILRAAGMQTPGRTTRPGSPYIEKDW
jgi:Ca-activated chloride channel family protein